MPPPVPRFQIDSRNVTRKRHGAEATPSPHLTLATTVPGSPGRPFRAPASEYGAGHRAWISATPGRPVLAAGARMVVIAGQVARQGVLSVNHDGGLRSTYGPVTPIVPAGAQVARGQAIGTVNPGHPGCPVAACLHRGMRRGEEYLNPLALIRSESVIRLKPWEPP